MVITEVADEEDDKDYVIGQVIVEYLKHEVYQSFYGSWNDKLKLRTEDRLARLNIVLQRESSRSTLSLTAKPCMQALDATSSP
ncbi:hypothetical protein BGZ65_000605 [Modicella reniformis]|uniref:Uncharacterized protein n=1 Tax=Modicella reniformis TaxID=1440133 RepID=A0A9P6SVD7_9FUNG|nr:hypothetical protein BGZ65_000605 [Modicella reniformis]